MASSLSGSVVAGTAGMSDMSSGAELLMLWMTSSSGTIPAGDGDCCCADIDADGRTGGCGMMPRLTGDFVCCS